MDQYIKAASVICKGIEGKILKKEPWNE